MKRLQRYILIETLKALVPAFASLLLIMVVGLCMQMLHEGLDVVRLRGLLLPMFAYCVPMVLPAAFLTAVIMNFGRLAADNEIIAVRAAGIHLMRVISPVLGLGVVLTLVAFYFQFELNPRAHASMDALQYDALKQVLMDKVALSGKRDLFFRGENSIHIQYQDFVNSRMVNLVIVESEAWNHRPSAIITAASATVRADASTGGNIIFNMKDCVITRFGLHENGEAETLVGTEGTLSPPLGGGPTDSADDDKFMGTIPLAHKVWDLTLQVAREEAALARNGLLPPAKMRHNPGEVRRKQRSAIKVIETELNGINKQLAPKQDELEKFGDREPARLTQLIDQGTKQLEQARSDLKTLKDAQSSLLQEISRMRAQEGGQVDFPHLTELQDRQKVQQTQIETQEQAATKLEAVIADDRTQLAACADKAAAAQDLVTVDEARKEKLLAARVKPASIAKWADDQDELNSLLIRVHKRLVEAASVFLFALLGIPLGIMAGGRSVMAAFGLSFAIVLVLFYPFVIIGQIAAEAGTVPIGPAIWAGNILVFIIGTALTVKVLRG